MRFVKRGSECVTLAEINAGRRVAVMTESIALLDSSTFRFARVSDQAVAWHLRRNCSATPRQLGLLYASLCLVSLSIGLWFWWNGFGMVMGFAGLELLVLGAAFLGYARHAADGETVWLQGGRLIVERECAGRRERMEFGSSHVRIADVADGHALIELSAHGRRVQIGRHVRPEWRSVVAGELRSALRGASPVATRG